MKKKIRVGLLVDDLKASAWVERMLERIAESHYASIELVVINGFKPSKSNSVVTKIKNNWGGITSTLIWKLLDLAQNKLIDRAECKPDAFEPKDLKHLLTGVPAMEVMPIRTKFSDHFRAEDVENIKRHEIDVLLRLGFRILRGEVLNSSKYGVWSYHHGDNAVNRGGPGGFWEAMESWPETGSMLQILGEDLDNGKVLCRSYACTYDLSVSFNRNGYFWKSLSFVPRKLKELYDTGGEAFLARVESENAHPVFYSNRLYTHPTNSEYAQLVLRAVLKKIRNKYFSTFHFDQWFLMFDLSRDFSGSLWRFKKILPPKDRFWADPHVLCRDGKYFIYIEEFPYIRQKGHISLIVMNEKGEYSPPFPVLEKPYHLSYPFVFEWEDEVYMIPETSENRTVELYKCVKFPDTWEFQMNLMEDVVAIDTTLFHSGGKWWLFTNIVENKGASSWDELFLFHSDTLYSADWIPHPLNPIVSDVKSARPAGKIFRKDGKIYRPSQNCSGHYGFGFNLCEITTLNEKEYREEVVASVKPNWDKNVISTHHFCREGNLTVIDGQIRRRK